MSIDNCSSGIICTDFSDHYTTFCYRKEVQIKSANELTIKGNFSRKNISKFGVTFHCEKMKQFYILFQILNCRFLFFMISDFMKRIIGLNNVNDKTIFY